MRSRQVQEPAWLRTVHKLWGRHLFSSHGGHSVVRVCAVRHGDFLCLDWGKFIVSVLKLLLVRQLSRRQHDGDGLLV